MQHNYMSETGASRLWSKMANRWLLAIAIIIICSSSATLGAVLDDKLTTSSSQDQLPPFDPPAGMGYWLLGVNPERWDTLKNILAKFKHFYITDPQSNKHLDEIRHRIDESQDRDPFSIITTLFIRGVASDRTSYLVPIVLDLLSLGINPDKSGRMGYRPINRLLGHRNWLPMIKALALCRVNMTVGNQEDNDYGKRSPLSIVEQLMQDAMNSDDNLRKEAIQEVHDILQKAVTDPTPLAQLASEKEWWAVKHLCRRAVRVDEVEAMAKYNGKTALEWAAFHGETGMVAELSYYFPSLQLHEPTSTTTSSTTPPVSSDRKDTTGPSDQMVTIIKALEEMNQAIADLRAELQALRATFIREKGSSSLPEDENRTMRDFSKGTVD